MPNGSICLVAGGKNFQVFSALCSSPHPEQFQLHGQLGVFGICLPPSPLVTRSGALAPSSRLRARCGSLPPETSGEKAQKVTPDLWGSPLLS